MMADDVYDHRDVQATCLDVDASSQYLALAGKRYVAVALADNPEKCDIKYARRSRWEAGCIRWCPNETNRTYLALTSSQSFELYVAQPGSGGITMLNNVRAHGRIITDLDWDYFAANRLATCSIDDNAHIWDLRDLKKPSLTLNVIAGANQIKWAKLLENLCATAHDGDIRVWDVRKGSSPVQYISAHLAKVHALDWHPKNDVQILSSGQERSLKLWDFTKPSKPEVQCNLSTPVWKAKFAPFENGLLTIPTPNVSHTERALTLWNCQDFSSAVHNFLGHTDLILDFCWRKPLANEPADFVQIISLSKDYTVRVWTLDSRMQQLCDQRRVSSNVSANGYNGNELGSLIEKGDESDGEASFDFKQSVGSGSGTQIELNDLNNLDVPNVTIEERLRDVCEQPQTGGQQAALETCLRRLPELVGEMLGVEQESTNVESSVILQAQMVPGPHILSTFLDARVPFPRTTGARFSTVGMLVCFRRPDCGTGEHGGVDALTPRSYSALANNSARELRNYFSIKGGDYSLKSYYQKEWRPARKLLSSGVKLHAREAFDEFANDLAVYDVSAMLPLHKELARIYCYPECESDLADVCTKNAKAAASVGRKDLVQAWTVLAYCVSSSLRAPFDEFDLPWAVHPFGRRLVSSLIDHLAKIGDVQSAATICCVLGKRPSYQAPERSCSRVSATSESAMTDRHRQRKKRVHLLFTGSPYNTVHSSEGIYEAWTGYLMRQRTGSCSDPDAGFSEHGTKSLYQFSHTDSKIPTVLREEDYQERSTRLLDPDLNDGFEALKQAYSDILFRWGMLNERATILKYSLAPPERYQGIEFVVQCKTCGADCRSPICSDCRKYAMICSICQMAVKGLCCVCSLCGHGGHTLHLAKWFEKQKKCPSGCGCNCLIG